MSNENVIINMIRAAKNSEPYVKTLADYARLSREFGSLESATEWWGKIIVEEHNDLTNEQVEELYNRFSLTIPAEGLRMPNNYILVRGENSITIYIRNDSWDYDTHCKELDELLNLSDEDILRDD